jgi:hypothetical protein
MSGASLWQQCQNDEQHRHKEQCHQVVDPVSQQAGGRAGLTQLHGALDARRNEAGCERDDREEHFMVNGTSFD